MEEIKVDTTSLSLEEVQAALSEIQTSNRESYEKLVQMGVRIDPSGILEIRLGLLLDVMFPDELSRSIFEYKFEEAVGEMLTHVQGEAASKIEEMQRAQRMQSLTAGMSDPGTAELLQRFKNQ